MALQPCAINGQPLAATSGTKKIELVRGGVVVGTYTEPDQLTPSLVQSGDTIKVYAAVYTKGFALGLQTFGDTPSAAASHTNVTVTGVLAGGKRPVIKPGPLYYGAGAYSGIISAGRVSGLVFENIDVDLVNCSPGAMKAGVYIASTRGDNIFRNMRIVNGANARMNGVISTNWIPSEGANALGWRGWQTFDSVIFELLGGDSGPEHGMYLGWSYDDIASPGHQTSGFKVVRSYFAKVFYGHFIKSRAQNLTAHGNYFRSTPDYEIGLAAASGLAESTLIQVVGTKNLDAQNNIFVSTNSGAQSNPYSIDYARELDTGNLNAGGGDPHPISTPWFGGNAGGAATLRVKNNLFVSYASTVGSIPNLVYGFPYLNNPADLANTPDPVYGMPGGNSYWFTNPSANWMTGCVVDVSDNTYVGYPVTLGWDPSWDYRGASAVTLQHADVTLPTIDAATLPFAVKTGGEWRNLSLPVYSHKAASSGAFLEPNAGPNTAFGAYPTQSEWTICAPIITAQTAHQDSTASPATTKPRQPAEPRPTHGHCHLRPPELQLTHPPA
jgi:hypothetical protein